jgi:hypothetical protein
MRRAIGIALEGDRGRFDTLHTNHDCASAILGIQPRQNETDLRPSEATDTQHIDR